MTVAGVRCRHAFEALTIHANGDAVCSIIDGRGDFIVGNVHRESLPEILAGRGIHELRRLVLSDPTSYCPAVGRNCPLKTIPIADDRPVSTTLRYLMIEPTTACDLRCLACPVRDIAGDVTWKNAYDDGGLSFAIWDGARRMKQQAADAVNGLIPTPLVSNPLLRRPFVSRLARGRMPRNRGGTLPIELVKRVITDAGAGIERIDLFNYGEPFLYRPLIDALRHIRAVTPRAAIAISTDGLQVRPETEAAIIDERLLDWIIFSVDGVDHETYSRYRIRGSFSDAWRNMVRFNERARNTGINLIWQYVVFRWNDSDVHLQRAISMSVDAGLCLQFDFAYTWGRSRRKPEELGYVRPYLRPFTALPGESRHDGW